MSHIEIITIGDELVEGRLIDSNAGQLSQKLIFNGLYVVRHVSVGDTRGMIVSALQEAASRSDAVIVTGGLGPTTDDLTAECAAEAFGRRVVRSEAALAHVTAYFENRGRAMSPNNYSQADLPEGCELIPNPWGTAVGFHVDHDGCRLYFMPGVPREMSRMFEATVLPDLTARLTASPVLVGTLRVFGTGESDVGHALSGLGDDLPAAASLTVQYRASFPEIQVRLMLKGGGRDAPTLLDGLKAEAHRRLAKYVFSSGEQHAASLAEVVLDAARQAGATLATAESCTGGLISSLLTDIPGSSDVFIGGAVTYANSAKVKQLEVPEALIETHGAVSMEVAEAMAQGARRAFRASHAVAVTGIAGPGGGSPQKPVGMICFAVASPQGVKSRTFNYPFDRERNRLVSAYTALSLLLRALNSDKKAP